MTFCARRTETLLEKKKNTKCATEVADVMMQNATENPPLTCTPLLFHDDLGAAGDEQDERCDQDVRRIERRYQGKWDPAVRGNYCCFIRGTEETTFERKKISVRRSILAFSSRSFSYDISVNWKIKKLLHLF